MNNKLKKIIIILAVIALSIGAVFYFRNQVYFSHGNAKDKVIFTIEKGDGNAEIAEKLKDSGLISGKIYFYYYVRTHNLLNKIMPESYELSGKMTIPEIAVTITQEKKSFIKITFPEGWTSKQMAQRLTANGLDGEGFLKLTKSSEQFRASYDFLKDQKIKNLDGYLFPDTYFFAKDASAENILKKMLDNFDQKLSVDLQQEITRQEKDINSMITLASIIEGEVRTDEDRKIVSGIFLNRIKVGQALQSCATLAYVLGEKKEQYSFADTRVASPYNTYLNKGLPPGPISNPGLSSIKAAIYPTDSQYNYFLSDPETGKTIFSKTLEEHNANKIKYGL
jgi:UPF0755 protein